MDTERHARRLLQAAGGYDILANQQPGDLPSSVAGFTVSAPYTGSYAALCFEGVRHPAVHRREPVGKS